MRRMLVLFNHKLTDEQVAYAGSLLQVTQTIYPPDELSKLWSAIDPGAVELDTLLLPIYQWIEKSSDQNDMVLVQGDFGGVYLVVNYCFRLGLVPVYSTTHRQITEIVQEDGSVRTSHVFRHVIYRKYGQ